jgi:aconitate hydratase
MTPGAAHRHRRRAPLAILGDSITTDHISPAGNIKADSARRQVPDGARVAAADFNSYGARRGNHEVMMRGTFANIRIKNEMVPGEEGGMSTMAMRREADLRRGDEAQGRRHAAGRGRRQGIRHRLLARLGGQGHQPAGRARRHRRELRAHPPLQPGRHGRAAAAVQNVG